MAKILHLKQLPKVQFLLRFKTIFRIRLSLYQLSGECLNFAWYYIGTELKQDEKNPVFFPKKKKHFLTPIGFFKANLQKKSHKEVSTILVNSTGVALTMV